jgi:hypothetical protein
MSTKEGSVTVGRNSLYIRKHAYVVDYVKPRKICDRDRIRSDRSVWPPRKWTRHHIQRYVDVNDFVQNEGNVEAHGFFLTP